MASDGSKSAAGASTELDKGYFNYSCFELMLIELVPMAQRIAEQLYTSGGSQSSNNSSGGKVSTKGETDETREAVFYRLEALGYRVGLGLVESITANHPLPSRTDPLDSIKLLCKDIWTAVFRKQIDNLKTNHRGVFVLTDNQFYPLKKCALEAGKAEEAKTKAHPFLHFPTGLIRGALSGLGMEAVVNAEFGPGGIPQAIFQVKTVGSK